MCSGGTRPIVGIWRKGRADGWGAGSNRSERGRSKREDTGTNHERRRGREMGRCGLRMIVGWKWIEVSCEGTGEAIEKDEG